MSGTDLRFPDRSVPGREKREVGAGRLPVTVFTGFLGAGKTSLIRRLLETPAGAKSALIVNEFGEIGIDDALLRSATEETILLNNGCVCCAVRSDLGRAMRELFAERIHGRIPDFRRVVVETSGLADPTPILQTLSADRTLGETYTLSGLVTVVDVASAERSAATAEWRKQVALADRLVLTKTALATPEALSSLRMTLERLAPGVPQFTVCEAAKDSGRLLAVADAAPRSITAPQAHDPAHTAEYMTFAVTRDAPIEWDVLDRSLTLLAALCGPELLRLKGIVNVRGRDGPVVVQRVQHLAHPPEALTQWPTDDRRTRLVLIGRGLDEAKIRGLLDAVWAFA